jgi:hypothetical protein
VRIADIDGDKRCDIIFLGVDGTVYMWYRNEFEDDNVSFHPMGGIQELPPCPQRDGVGQFDLAFVFADLKYVIIPALFARCLETCLILLLTTVAIEKPIVW